MINFNLTLSDLNFCISSKWSKTDLNNWKLHIKLQHDLRGFLMELHGVAVVLQRVEKSCRGIAKSFAIFFAKMCNPVLTLCNSSEIPCNSITTPCNSCYNSLWSCQLVEDLIWKCFSLQKYAILYKRCEKI